jgi:hypothetical protein
MRHLTGCTTRRHQQMGHVRFDHGPSIVSHSSVHSNTLGASLTNLPSAHPMQVGWTSRQSNAVRTRTVSAALYKYASSPNTSDKANSSTACAFSYLPSPAPTSTARTTGQNVSPRPASRQASILT